MSKILVRDENFNPKHDGDDHFIVFNGRKYGWKEKIDDIRSMDVWLYDLFVTLEK